MVGARGSGNKVFNMKVIAGFSIFVEGFKRSFEDFWRSSGVFKEIGPFLLGSRLCHVFFNDGFIGYRENW